MICSNKQQNSDDQIFKENKKTQRRLSQVYRYASRFMSAWKLFSFTNSCNLLHIGCHLVKIMTNQSSYVTSRYHVSNCLVSYNNWAVHLALGNDSQEQDSKHVITVSKEECNTERAYGRMS